MKNKYIHERDYVTGHRHNCRGPRRTTVVEPDEIAVQRYVGGDRPAVLATVDRDAAIDYLDARKCSAREIAVQLGLTMRTVTRRRAARRASAR